MYGTLIDRAGVTRHLDRDAFTVTVDRRLDEPGDRRRLPGRLVDPVPSASLEIGLVPTVAAQELDTRATTGVVYWEGSQRVAATRAGRPRRRPGVCRADGVRAGALTGREARRGRTEGGRAEGGRAEGLELLAGPPTGVRSTFGNDTLAMAARSRDAASSAVSPCRTLSILREVSRYADLSDSESRRPSWAIARTWS